MRYVSIAGDDGLARPCLPARRDREAAPGGEVVISSERRGVLATTLA